MQEDSDECPIVKIFDVVRPEFNPEYIKTIEGWIDEIDSNLPPLTNFILPSGGKASACLHVARTVARRAERNLTPLIREKVVDHNLLVYLNRSSDFLFAAARRSAQLADRTEKIFRSNRVVERNL
jgi:cob(I)alamin adenosyltransferase